MLHDVSGRRWRRLARALGVAAAAAALLPPAATAGDRCRGAGAEAASARGAALRAALVCLVNQRRRAHELPPLARDRRLARAAGRHARDMARRGYFAHQRAGGPDLGARLRRAGWRGRASGEAIAYGCGAAGTPRAAVRMWMGSPPHRALLLSAAFGEAGPGFARRAPVGCRGATWVLDLGAPGLP